MSVEYAKLCIDQIVNTCQNNDRVKINFKEIGDLNEVIKAALDLGYQIEPTDSVGYFWICK